MIPLWDFQQELVNQTRQAMRKHKNVLLQAPTGSGKTRMASHIIQECVKKGKRAFFNCHRTELVDQSFNTLSGFGIKPSIIQAGRSYHDAEVCIASIDTLKNRLSNVRSPDLMIWDEAHHIRAGGWTKIHESFPNCYHLGLSATPLRADGKGLCENFDYIVPGPQTYDLIKGGYLAEYDLFSCEPISDEETDRNIITVAGSLIESYIKNAEGKKAIGFAPSVYLSKQLAIKFTQNGIPAAHLDGTMNKDERKSILMRLATGEIMVVFNYNLFAEGFDISANTGMDVTVGCLIAAQKTGSLSRWLQMCGRVLRKQAGRAVINDHAGNFFLHGAPCDIRIWTLDGVKNEQETMRQCPICYYANDVVSNCVFCGYAMADERETTETGNKKLVERSDIKKIDLDMRRSFIDTATPEQLKLFEKERGYKRGWHKHILRARAEKTLLINRALSLGAKENVIYMKPKEIREVIKKYECS